MTVKETPGLSTTVAEGYRARFDPRWVCAGPRRAVRACLAARDGAGFILLDAADLSAERVSSLTHELAHFLWHYGRPRQRAGKQLGHRAAEVFDGKRELKSGERLRAVVANIPSALMSI